MPSYSFIYLPAPTIGPQAPVTYPSHLQQPPGSYQSQSVGGVNQSQVEEVNQPQLTGLYQAQLVPVYQPHPTGVDQPKPIGVHQPQPTGVHQPMSVDNRNLSVITDDGMLKRLLLEFTNWCHMYLCLPYIAS